MTTTTNVKQVKLNVMTQAQYNSATKNPTELYMITDAPAVTVDSALSTTSENPVQNKVVTNALNGKVAQVSTANKIYGTDASGNQTTYNKTDLGGVSDVKVGTTSVVTNTIATLGTMAGEATTSYYTKSELDGKLSGAMHFKGTKATVSALPSSGQEVGDMWNVTETGANYAWDGTNWDKLSENIDLSGLQPNLTSANAGTGISITGSGANVVISSTQSSATWGNITGTLSNQTDLQNALNLKYDASNPNGYTSNIGTVTSVNNTSPDDNGNVNLNIPTVNNATLTIKQNNTSKGTFTANASSNVEINLTDTTYSAFTGADGTNAGTSGLVPAPTATDNNKFLKGDGTWSLLSSGSRLIVDSFTATANQTTFTLSEKCDNKDYLSVNVSNSELTSSAYSLAADGMSVTLLNGVEAGALVDVRYFTDLVFGDSGATYTPTQTKSGRTATITWTNDRSLPNPQSVNLYDGIVWTPTITTNQQAGTATLSWTNDGGLPNPQSVTMYLGNDNTTQRYVETFTATANQTQFVASRDIESGNVLTVNIENTDLLHSSFSLGADKRTVTIVDPVEEGAKVELRYFHNLIMAQDGYTFTPHVSKSGYTTTLSWTYDGGMTNPSDVNVYDGVIWTPAVTATDGGYNLSWTNDQGKQNPSTVFINSIYAVGAWSSTMPYTAGNLVTYEDSNYYYGYIAKQNIPAGTALTNTTYWTLAYTTSKQYIAATIVDWGE